MASWPCKVGAPIANQAGHGSTIPFSGDRDSKRRRQASANRVFTILKAALNHAFHDGKVPLGCCMTKVKPFKGVDKARLRQSTLATQIHGWSKSATVISRRRASRRQPGNARRGSGTATLSNVVTFKAEALIRAELILSL
jgi:hypothetical protein